MGLFYFGEQLMELTSLFPIAADLAITLPSGEETGIVFKVLGQDSTAFRKGAKAMASAFQQDDKPTPDVMERINNEIYAGCIVSWSGLEENGAPLAYSPEKALELIAKPELTFIREQVEAFVSKRAQFFRKVA